MDFAPLFRRALSAESGKRTLVRHCSLMYTALQKTAVHACIERGLRRRSHCRQRHVPYCTAIVLRALRAHQVRLPTECENETSVFVSQCCTVGWLSYLHDGCVFGRVACLQPCHRCSTLMQPTDARANSMLPRAFLAQCDFPEAIEDCSSGCCFVYPGPAVSRNLCKSVPHSVPHCLRCAVRVSEAAGRSLKCFAPSVLLQHTTRRFADRRIYHPN